MFINIGTMDGFTTGKMLNYLIEMTGLSAGVFERINVKGAYSFIDMKESYMQEVLEAFENEVYKGRKIRVDGSGGGGGSRSGSGGSKSGGESGAQKSSGGRLSGAQRRDQILFWPVKRSLLKSRPGKNRVKSNKEQ